MTSRERVNLTVNFQTPDRVPIDLGSMRASGINASAYHRLKRHLGLGGGTRIFDIKQMTAHVEEPLRRRFHVDVIPLDLPASFSLLEEEAAWIPRRLFDGTEVLLPPGTGIEVTPEDDWVLLDQHGSPTSYRMPRGGFYFDDTSYGKATGEFDPQAFRPLTTIPDQDLERLAGLARHLYHHTEYALLGWGPFGPCFLGLSFITGNNVTMGRPADWMMMLLTEPDTCHQMMHRAVEATISCLKLVHQAVGDYCFAWGIAADDSGTQRGEVIRPELWDRMIKPHYRQLCDWIHQHTNWKTFLHCCGSVYHLIPHFIEAGIDILNPVQTSAAQMEPERLKREFGGRIVFWGGGCDTQRVLGSAGPEQVREHVRQRLEIFKPGGGYVFNQVHNIQPNVPAENITAAFDAAYQHGAY